MKKQILLSAVGVSLISLGMAGSADAALVGRLPANTGGTDYQAYYDEDADLTWLVNADVIAMNWADANSWVANFSIDGVTGWRLPTTMQPDASCDSQSPDSSISSGTGCTGSEMGHLFNVEGISVATPGPFSNIHSSFYWSGTEFAPNASSAWAFDFGSGSQGAPNKDSSVLFAWAVRSGDVGAVPVPAAVWLFGSGLLGLIGIARRKNTALQH